jgi:hypothetical protein
MIKLIFTFLLSLLSLISFAQISCISHWSKDGARNSMLDTIFSKVNFKNIDSVVCEYKQPNADESNLQISFFNKQIGKYFSNAKAINFIKFYARERGDEYFNEIHILQFDLPEEDLNKFRKKYGTKINGYGYFNISVFTLYRYLVKDNSVFFICTESYERGNPKTAYFFDSIFETFVSF